MQSGNNAQISWAPPQISCGDIQEYSVYLSIKSDQQQDNSNEPKTLKNQHLTFIQVYCGSESSCTVDSETLTKAYIDVSSKPAILFRIAAKNDKGYGPATQVRWLQQGNTYFEKNLKSFPLIIACILKDLNSGSESNLNNKRGLSRLV